MTAIRAISEVITDMNAALTEDQVSVGQILEAFHERGFGFLLLIFAFPMALPIPKPPGLSTILAIPLILLTVQQALGFHTIWFPAFIRRKSFSSAAFSRVIETSIPWLKKIEALARPRLGMITQGAFSNVIGVCGLIMALWIAVPMPLSNTVPSIGIALMAIGVMMRDGVFVLAGAVIGLLWVFAMIFVIVFLGMEGLDLIVEYLRSFFG